MTLRFLTDLVILVHGQSFNNEHPPLQKKNSAGDENKFCEAIQLIKYSRNL